MTMAPTRIEHDSLGPCEVPTDALYGVRTARIVEHLSFSRRTLGSCPEYVAAIALVKRAAARANGTARVLASDLVAAIEAATEFLPTAELAPHLPADILGGGGAIGININVNEVLANLANETLGGCRGVYAPVDPRQHVNASQSTADVCHAAARLAVIRGWPPLAAALARAGDAFDAFLARDGDVPTLARTCLRDALPTPVATLFGGHRALLRRRGAAVESALAALHSFALGATVIGTGVGAPQPYRDCVVAELAALSGLPLRRSLHPADALQNSDDLASVSAALAQLAQAFIKLAQDVRLLASGPAGGFGELRLPVVHEGSSFFPGKANPSVAETLLQGAFQMIGADRAAQEAARAAELHLNVFDTQVAINVIDAMNLAAGALDHFAASCIEMLSVDAERCRALAAQVSRT